MTDLVAFSAPQEGAVFLTHATQAELLRDVEQHLAEKRGFALATLNLDHVVKLQKDPVFRTSYLAQTYVVADGNPIVWLSKMAGRKVDLITGSDTIRPMVEIAVRTGTSIAFLGSTQEILDAVGKVLKAEFPGLEIAAAIAPPYGFDPESDAATEALAEIARSGAGLCFLALGAPKQEILAARGRMLAPSVGFASVGAGLDFISGKQKRAPEWVRRLALEWLWRMLSNPARLTSRYLSCITILPELVQLARRQGKA